MTSSAPPPPIGEPLNTYFAAQLKAAERPHHVAQEVMKAAKGAAVLFRHLEVMDTVSVGTFTFVRMRSEIINPFPILDRLYEAGRGVVAVSPGGEYLVRLPGGRSGRVAQAVMHATAKLGQSRMYRGTKFKFWDRQFEAA